MKIIGITGGIASGKSYISQLLMKRGFHVIDADIGAREVVRFGTRAYYKIIDVFGKKYVDSSKEIDRARLGQLIFSSKKARKTLDEIVHPYVFEWINLKKDLAKQNGESIVFIDIPLLFECGIQRDFTKIILVYVSSTTQIIRLMSRNKVSHSIACQMIASQMSLSEKKKLSDYVIDNNGTKSNTKAQLEEIINEVSSL